MSFILRITLDKSYSGGEEYTVSIDYIAKSNEINALENQTFLDGRGLNFTNPTGQDKNMLHTQSFHNFIT